jgi:hypothetical protein
MMLSFFESRGFWAVLGLVTLSAAFLTAWLVAAYPFVSAASYGCIDQGMTAADVEAVFGGPPGDYRSSARLRAGFSNMHPTNIAVAGAVGWREWVCDEGRIWIWFDGEERVVFKHFMAWSVVSSQSPILTTDD